MNNKSIIIASILLIVALSGCVSSNNSNEVELSKSFSNGDVSFNYPSSWEEMSVDPSTDPYGVTTVVSLYNDTDLFYSAANEATSLERILKIETGKTDYENGGYIKTKVDNKSAILLNTTLTSGGNKQNQLIVAVKSETGIIYSFSFLCPPNSYDENYQTYLRIIDTIKIQ